MFTEESNENRLFSDGNEYNFVINGESENIEETIANREEKLISEGMEKYMPIGSVVSLNDSEKQLMIIGFNSKFGEQTYDYVGCAYPYGFDGNKIFPFMHSQIDKVYHVGFINALEREFKSNMNQGDDSPSRGQ